MNLSLSFVGLVAAAAAFFGVWGGHVAVRKIEARVPALWVPVAAAVALGLVLEASALRSPDVHVSAALGILGATVLWDALEFVRQHRRVQRGHAPANPSNPRHARLLAAGQATTVDWLARDPARQPARGEKGESP